MRNNSEKKLCKFMHGAVKIDLNILYSDILLELMDPAVLTGGAEWEC